MINRRLILVPIICLFTVACQNSSQVQSNPTSINTENVEFRDKAEPLTPELLISSRGIGKAQLGLTYGELKSQLGSDHEFKIVSPFMVDFDAIAVYQQQELQYYLVYPAASTLQENDAIEVLMTDNPKYLTAEGVGVGKSITKATQIYGEATLSYNTNNESREYVVFANEPFSNVYFRPATEEDTLFAGIYEDTTGEYNRTTEFRPEATIKMIEVMMPQR